MGWNQFGQCDAGNWTDVTEIAAGGHHTVGLRTDGAVLAVGDNGYGQCDVGGWTNITQVATGYGHTVGLRVDGTVVAIGNNEAGQCMVGDWTDVVQVAVGYAHTVGLRADGTVVAVGANDYGQRETGDWTDIRQITAAEGYHSIAAGYGHTVGVDADGTVVAVGHNDDGQCSTYGWADIVGVAAGNYHTVGLRSNGTVLAAGLEVELAKWDLGSPGVDLAVSSVIGGEAIRPGEGTFTYYPGRRLNLVARPESGYHFVGWAGDVDSIDNVNAAQTSITMDGDYSVTANFEEKPPVNWVLVGGIAGAAVIAGLIVFVLRREKGVQKKRPGNKTTRTKRR